jgi:sialate O-acetylesterase
MMKKIRWFVWVWGLAILWTQAELTVASPFTDNAVLQRGQPVPVWGSGERGGIVTVEFAGQTKTAKVDSSRHWKIFLDPMPASSEPRKMTIQHSNHPPVHCSNLVVGEVWICAGQSNMEMEVGKVPQVKALIPTVKNIRSFEVGRTVAFSEQDRCVGSWKEEPPTSAVAFAFAYALEELAQVPIGIIHTSWGSTSIEGWMPRDMIATLPHFKNQMKGFDADEKKHERIETILNGPQPWGSRDIVYLRTQPNIVYNAMMHPLVPTACRGLVWYQGEANAENLEGMQQYADTLSQWVARCREGWKNEKLHFIVAMLPGYGKVSRDVIDPEDPSVLSWAWMREAQLSVLKLPHTSVANDIDLGHLTDIHPKDKLPVGKRLALLAARDTLGLDIEAQGPVAKTVKRNGARVIVSFDHADGLTTTDGAAPAGFWVADSSRDWKKAEAELSGKTVILTSPEVRKPRYVRYAFAGKPTLNLVNGAGLPAYPFRTDDFTP